MTFHPQYIVNEQKQTTAVILPVAEWDSLLEEIEELDAIRAYDAAKSEPSDVISLEQALAEIDGRKS
jgi:PHD/YefM family antitoxin component YafN of YafNO toxin-antitoxin module